MGASVWQREGAAGGGKTFTSGVVASAPRNAPRPGKRKLIWKRDEHQGGGDAAQPEPDASKDVENNSKKPRTGSASESCAQPPAPSNGAGGLRQKPSQMHAASVQHGSASNGLSRPTGAAQYQHAAAGPGKAPSGQNGQAPAAGTAGRQQSSAQSPVEELRQLKEKIAARQAQLQREQAAAKAQAEAEKRQKEEMNWRKSRLQASMAEAFKEARDAVAEAAAKRAPGASTAADEKEVARVLRARDDYEVLRLSPGCTLTALKKRYREMAVVLHPDKSTAARATDAFQRFMEAYQNILKLLA
ncbi:g7975 [Coccomyxa viridis]|uniref:G7975 protein n=1 Tax=Coccomyxa viridis TaxID=1274662 RepID=A0ABP1G5Q8_9CHLO